MRKGLLYILMLSGMLLTCQQEEPLLFEQDAATRVAEAIAALKGKLVAPASGWRMKYRPESESGSYYVLLDFNEDNSVSIKTDLGAEEGEYFNQTITYRVDNSLGLELIFENYSFFSYLFEQDQASFGAEFEFNYVNEASDGSLVFRSKSDPGFPTTIVMEVADPLDTNLLGTGISENISQVTQGFAALTTVLKLSYTERDVAIYLNLDDFRRTLKMNYISKKSTSQNGQKLSFSTAYTLQGNSIVLDDPLTGSFNGTNINISSIALDQLSSDTTMICTDSLIQYTYTGTLSSNDPIELQTSVFDPEGQTFNQNFGVFRCPVQNIFDDSGFSVGQQVEDEIEGALELQLYFIEIEEGPLEALGFALQNPNGSITFALRHFSYVIDQNRIELTFDPDYTLYGDPNASIDATAMNKYLDLFTEGNNTYIYRYSDTIYEFYNPCNGHTFFFIASN